MSISFRGAAALALVAAVAACTDNSAKVLGPTPAGSGLFDSYVSLGNSITAGYQSGGINDSTQKRSYAVLLAGQMGTRFAYPSIAMPGCPPPIANFLTQARATTTTSGPTTGSSCFLRAGTAAVLNNVAVPGATSFDPDAPGGTPFSNLLTQLILGGQDQVQRARQANPTFATVWIGNNDVLAPALSGVLVPLAGVSPGLTPQTTFQTNYDAIIADLTKTPSRIKGGVLIGVFNVTNVPVLFPVSLLLNSPQFKGAFDQAAGYNPASSDPFKNTPINIEANCTANPTTLVSFLIAPQIAAFRNDSTKAPTARTGHPPDISCGTSSIYPAPVGQVFILEPSEITAVSNAVTAMNSYIASKAQSVGFAYFDPNKVLDSLKTTTPPQIVPGPNFAAPTAPFGKWISLDGIHPSSAAHQLLANYLIEAINSKYSTSLAKLPNP
jgi:lysophospholipase L1-like esterase